MSYTLNLTNGSPLITLSDGNADQTKTSITLIGKNYPGYGQFLNENFIKMLENFSNNSAPASPLKGQLWWDTIDNILKVYTGNLSNGNTGWKISTGATSSVAPPNDLSTIGGDLWFDSANQQLKVYTGSPTGGPQNNGWVTVGPVVVAGTGNTTVTPARMTSAGSGQTIVVLQFIIQGTIYAIFSPVVFSPADPTLATAFPIVNAGVTFNKSVNPSMEISTSGDIYCGTVYGTASRANYADLAERFETDVALDAGTVVELGGAAEITISRQELSENVFGVISTRAAYLMNSDAGDDLTHPAVAVQGRVPVKVIGIIEKGDRLVSAGNGFARAGKREEISTWNVIGRSLENKTDFGVGVIEAVVKINS